MSAKKILIVEDEQAIREMIAFHLSRAGYDTIEACDCREARELLADKRPDLALVDWMLPDSSGLELTRMLKRDPNYDDLAIIMLTARADERDKVSGRCCGARKRRTMRSSQRASCSWTRLAIAYWQPAPRFDWDRRSIVCCNSS